VSTIGNLFGRSPFGQIQAHMNQVKTCVEKMDEAVTAMSEGRFEELDDMAYEVSKLEHHADQLKGDIRNHLFRRFFMPIQPSEILEIVSLQDSLADTAEDVCKVMTFKKLPFPDGIQKDFEEFNALSMKAFRGAVAEHEVDVVQLRLLKTLYENDTSMSVGEFHLWMRLTRLLSRISNLSENLANRVLKTLSIK